MRVSLSQPWPYNPFHSTELRKLGKIWIFDSFEGMWVWKHVKSSLDPAILALEGTQGSWKSGTVSNPYLSFDIRMPCLVLWHKLIWKIACISQEGAVPNKQKAQWPYTIKYISLSHHCSMSWWKRKAWSRLCAMQSFRDPGPDLP